MKKKEYDWFREEVKEYKTCLRLCDSEKKVFEKNNFCFCRRRQESRFTWKASFQFNDVECEWDVKKSWEDILRFERSKTKYILVNESQLIWQALKLEVPIANIILGNLFSFKFERKTSTTIDAGRIHIKESWF
jgi:hypothetical protein